MINSCPTFCSNVSSGVFSSVSTPLDAELPEPFDSLEPFDLLELFDPLEPFCTAEPQPLNKSVNTRAADTIERIFIKPSLYFTCCILSITLFFQTYMLYQYLYSVFSIYSGTNRLPIHLFAFLMFSQTGNGDTRQDDDDAQNLPFAGPLVQKDGTEQEDPDKTGGSNAW